MPVNPINEKDDSLGVSILKRAFDCSPAQIMIIDPDRMGFVDANQTALASLGYTKDEFLNLVPADIDAVFDNETLATAFDSIIKSKEQHATFPTKHKRKDKSIYDVEVYLSCFKENERNYIMASATTVSVLKKAQEALTFHSVLLNNISDAIISTNEDFVITSWNKHAEEIFGWTQSEALGKQARDLAQTVYPDVTSDEIVEFLFQNSYWKGEIITRKKNGESIYANISVGLLRDDYGSITGTVSVVRDISERGKLEEQSNVLNEQLERKVAEKTEELTSVFERITDGFTAFDKDWNYTYINKKAAEIINADPKEIIGKKITDIFPEIHTSAVFDYYIQAMKEQKVIKREAFVTNLQKWFEGVLYPSPQGLSIYFHDITDKKNAEIELLESELKYRLIVETAQEGIWTIDENFKTTFVNQKICELLEYTQEEMIGQTTYSFRLKDDQPGILARHELRKKGISEIHETELVSKSGRVIYARISTNPIFDNDGNFKGSVAMVTDVTDIKKAEEEKEFEKRNRDALINSTTDLIWSVTSDFKLITGNKAFLKSMRESSGIELKPGDELLINRGLSSDYLNFWKRLYERALEGQPFIEEIRANAADGQSQKWFEISFNPILKENLVDGVVCFSRDITQKKIAAETIKESEERYRTIVETAQEGIWQVDENSTTYFVNDFMASMLGYSKEEMVGTSLFNYMSEEDNAVVKKRVDMRKNGVAEQHEFRFLRKDKTFVETILQSAPIFKNDQYAGSLAMVIDNTARKQAEEKLLASERRFRALIEKSADGIVLTSPEGIITYASPSAQRIMELPGDEIVGQLCLQFIEPEFHRLVVATSEDVVNHPSISQTIEYRIKTPAGSQKWLESTSTNLLDEPAVNAVVINFKDITERKLFETELKESEAKYRRAERMGKLGHWEWDLIDNGLIWSDEIYNIFGLDKTIDKLDYNTFYSQVHPDDRQMLQQEINNTLARVAKHNMFHRILLANGSVRHVHEVGELIEDETGRIVKFAGMVQDVTEQKVLEEQLRLSENNYRLLFQKNPVPLFMVDSGSQRFLEVNEAAVKTYGYCEEEFLTMNLWQLRLMDDESLMLHLLEPFNEESLFISTGTHKKKNGENIIVKVTSNKIFYKEKWVWLASVDDITAEINYARNLKEREQQLSLVFENTINPMWLLKPEDNEHFRIEVVNEALLNILGLSKEEMVGKLVSEVLDLSLFSNFVAKTNEAVRSGVIQKYITVRNVKGGEKIFEVAIIPIKDEQQKVVQLLGVSHDLTELKKAEQKLVESEEKYLLLFHKSPVPMWIYSIDTFHFLEVNPAAIKQYGYTREEFLNLSLTDIRRDGKIALPVEEQDENYRNSFLDTSVHYKKNGETIKVHVSVSSIQFENRKARLALLIDRTEQETIKDNLITTTQQLRELAAHLNNVREDERTNIAREIHDELGQQLTGLKMDIAWLNRKLIRQDETIEAKIKSSLQLIDGTINTVRRIASELRPGILDDLGLSDAIEWLGRAFAKRTSIEVSFSSEAQEMKFSPQISIALFRIFQEALTNVARHSGATFVQSSLTKKGNTLVLTISDNGRGFELKELDGRKTLGILGMKERVVILNGNYDISSKPGKGTVVSVLIPLES